MCRPTETRRPGILGSLPAWLTGRTGPIPAGPDPEPPIVRPDRPGLPRCERCGAYRLEDDANCHRRWCGACDLQWLDEEVAAPLVARLGRRGARRALKALVRGEIR